jgi:hypothetical protein
MAGLYHPPRAFRRSFSGLFGYLKEAAGGIDSRWPTLLRGSCGVWARSPYELAAAGCAAGNSSVFEKILAQSERQEEIKKA